MTSCQPAETARELPQVPDIQDCPLVTTWRVPGWVASTEKKVVALAVQSELDVEYAEPSNASTPAAELAVSRLSDVMVAAEEELATISSIVGLPPIGVTSLAKTG